MDIMEELDENTIDFTKKTWREDITFVVEEKRLYAAKNVLDMVSPVFETMFSSTFKEKDKEEISLPEKKFEEFHEFLKCVYPSLKDIDKVNVVMVLPLADEYQVSSLKRRCGEFLLKHLKNNILQMDKSEILRCYSMGLNYNIVGIGELCIKLMCLHSQVELGDDDVKHIDKETLVMYHNDMSVYHRSVQTKHMKLLMKMSNNLVGTETVTDLENALGITFEHTIANMLEFSFQKPQLSKEVSVWNVKFQLITKIQGDNYMAVCLRCIFPDDSNGWTCRVDASYTAETTIFTIFPLTSSKLRSANRSDISLNVPKPHSVSFDVKSALSPQLSTICSRFPTVNHHQPFNMLCVY